MSKSIHVVGTVATAPSHYVSQAGVSFCQFRLAENERRYDREKNEWVSGETNWFSVHAFRSLADNAKNSFTVGDRVVVTGRLRVRNWERDGKSGTNVELEAEALGHDLRWGVSTFTRQSSSETAASADAADRGMSSDAPSQAQPQPAAPPQSAGMERWADTPIPAPETAPLSADGFTPEVPAAA